jgi:geranylgeranyl pyrophosphate synthase
MVSAIEDVEPYRLREALLHAIQGGKKIRPLLVCLACSAAGGSWQNALGSAAAVEFMHTASLIHDDIMDDSSLRRGKPTLHTLYDTSLAILAGDTLVALAFETLVTRAGLNVSHRLHTLSGAFRQLCQGQAYDLGHGTDSVDIADRALRTTQGKTAALFRAAAEIGALHVTTDPEIVVPLSEFGFAIGMAFQAKDDLLDVAGVEEMIGKPVHRDQSNGRITWLSAGSGGGTIEHVCKTVEHYTASALDALSMLPPSPARDSLEQLAHALEQRNT